MVFPNAILCFTILPAEASTLSTMLDMCRLNPFPLLPQCNFLLQGQLLTENGVSNLPFCGRPGHPSLHPRFSAGMLGKGGWAGCSVLSAWQSPKAVSDSFGHTSLTSSVLAILCIHTAQTSGHMLNKNSRVHSSRLACPCCQIDVNYQPQQSLQHGHTIEMRESVISKTAQRNQQTQKELKVPPPSAFSSQINILTFAGKTNGQEPFII